MNSLSQPLVSVIIPTHNRSRTLGAAIFSVLTQTYKNIEVIVVDDGSSDETDNILENINDKRLRALRLEKNRGASAARNIGIKAARGSFVAFQDSDDIWLPEKIEKQLKSYYEMNDKFDNVVGVFCRFVKILENNRSVVIPEEKNLLFMDGNYHDLLLHHNIVGTPTLLIDVEKMDHIVRFDESLRNLEDWDLALTLTESHRLAFVDDVMVCSPTSTDGINKESSSESVQRIIKNHETSFNRNKKFLAAQYLNISFYLLNFEDTVKAKEYFLKSIRSYKKIIFSNRSIKILVRYIFPIIYSRLKKLNNK